MDTVSISNFMDQRGPGEEDRPRNKRKASTDRLARALAMRWLVHVDGICGMLTMLG